MIFPLLVSVVLGQGCYEFFDLCIEERGPRYMEFTCLPLMRTNATLYNQCSCYSLVKLTECYGACQEGNQTAANMRTDFETRIAATCPAAGN